MAGKIKRKNTKAKVNVEATINGELVKTTTTRVCVGDQNAETGKCKKCIKSGRKVALICTQKKADKMEVEKAKNKKKNKSGGQAHANGAPRGAMKARLIQFFEEGCWARSEINTIMKEAGYKSWGCDITCAMKGKKSDAKRYPYKVVENTDGKLEYDLECPKGSWGQA